MYHVSAMMTVVVVGSVAGCFVILAGCVVFIIWRQRRKRRQSDLDHILFDGYDEHTCTSAPISRKSSPKLVKRLSCPNVYGTVEPLHHSVSTGEMQGYQLSAEHMQAAINGEGSGHTPQPPYQHSFVGTLQPNIPHVECGRTSPQPPAPTTDHGCIGFSTQYDVTTGQLAVTLVKLRQLSGRSNDDPARDPYVNIFLLPDEQTCRRSKVIKKTLNPVFNETFTFLVGADEVPTRSLKFSVYDVDRRRIRHSLGHVVVPLQDFEYKSSSVIWRDIAATVLSVPPAGEMNIGLTYLPHVEQVKVTVLTARNLREPGNGANHDYSARIEYYNGTNRLKTHHTETVTAGQEASFNEAFSFSTAGRSIDNCNFVITLLHSPAPAPAGPAELGHVTLGSFMYARGAALLHWRDMMANTRATVTRWHHLTVQC